MEINTTKKSKEGKQRQCKVFCVAGGPNNKLCANNGDTPGVNMHRFPTEPSIRQQWVRFVKMHRVDFNPSNYSSRIYLCSAHFEPNCYSKRFADNLEGFNPSATKCFLTRGSVPTIYAPAASSGQSDISVKEKRRGSL